MSECDMFTNDQVQGWTAMSTKKQFCDHGNGIYDETMIASINLHPY